MITKQHIPIPTGSFPRPLQVLRIQSVKIWNEWFRPRLIQLGCFFAFKTQEKYIPTHWIPRALGIQWGCLFPLFYNQKDTPTRLNSA